ncbi:MAG: histidine phosphatase family protein [Xanthobacteraceae bacterium]
MRAEDMLYFIRHGETDWNVAGRLQGRTDTPLNATGRRQGIACGQILRGLIAGDGKPLSQYSLVASPLSRARETMELALGSLAAAGDEVDAGLPPDRRTAERPGRPERRYRTDARLEELTFGAWEGFTLTEIAARQPDMLAARERDKWRFVPPGGESYEQLCERVRNWYRALDRDTIAVAHGGTFRVLLVITGLATPQTAPSEWVTQGAVYRFAGGSVACYE